MSSTIGNWSKNENVSFADVWPQLEALLAVNPGVLPAKTTQLDTPVLLFTLGASVLTGIIFGLAPALQLSRIDLHTTLKEGGRSGGEGAGARRARNTFVVVQVALSLVLLVGGALLVKSFYKLLQVDPGFRPANLLTLEYRLPRNKYTQADGQWQFHRQVARLSRCQSPRPFRTSPSAGRFARRSTRSVKGSKTRRRSPPIRCERWRTS